MKILLAAPHMNEQRGNSVTVNRIAVSLKQFGIETEIIDTTLDRTPAELPQTDLVHGFHARRFQEFLLRMDKAPENYIITITGTDLNHDLFDSIGRPIVLECLKNASAIHVFHDEAANTLRNAAPALSDKIHVIHQGAKLPTVPSEAKEHPFTFFLPAGIRKVKNIPSAIDMLSQLREQHEDLQLLLAGPILEKSEGDIVMELVDKNKNWIQYAGAVPHSEMGSLYNKADVVLNTSLTEGQPAAVLEAMEARIPVLVSGNNGNRSLINHNENGLIYETPEQFIAYAGQLFTDARLRKRLGDAAGQFTKAFHSTDYEAKALLDLYKQILQA